MVLVFVCSSNGQQKLPESRGSNVLVRGVWIASPIVVVGEMVNLPEANSDALEDYAKYLWDVGDIACDVLGKAECVRQIRGLAELGNPSLQEAACHFLKGQMGVDCIGK